MYKNLIVVGGGFAGTKVTQELEHTLPPDWTLTLMSQENFITFNPLLPEVVGASILPGHVIAPHRQMLHCSMVCMAQVSEIDTAAKKVHYLGEGPGSVSYDQLVLACGTNANLDLVRGMGQYALPLKTLGDALFLRNRIIARLEQAELQPDVEHRRWLTSFVVVGGGFSGVETVGELVDFLHASLKYYKRVRADDLRLNGRPTRAFRYRPKGQLASVGHNKAVAEVAGLKLSGFIAWLAWRGLYLLRIPTLARKSRLFLEWNWAMFFPPDIAHFGYRRTQRRAALRPAPSDNATQVALNSGG